MKIEHSANSYKKDSPILKESRLFDIQSFPNQAGFFDFSMTGKILISGEKRADFLQGIITNDINGLQPGQSIKAFFLDIFGKIQADVTVYAFKDHLLLLLPFLQIDNVQNKLEKDAKLVNCEIKNVTFDFALLSVIGTNSQKLLEKTFGHINQETFTLHSLHSKVFTKKGGVDKAKEQSTLNAYKKDTVAIQDNQDGPSFTSLTATGDFAIIKTNRLKTQNYDLLIPKLGLEKVMTKLKQNNIQKQESSQFNLQRIKDRVPLFSTDYNESNNPLELNKYAEDFLSDTKGCYLGQEIVARLKHRANSKTPKKLVFLQTQNLFQTKPFNPKEMVFYNNQGETIKVGHITSSAYDKSASTVYSIAFLQKPYYDTLLGQEVLIGDNRVRAKIKQC